MRLFKTYNDNSNTEREPVTERKGVMIVDDSRFSRNVLRDILKNEGYEVVGEAGDGLEALQLAEKIRPEIIFLDVEMPKLDGLGAIPKLLEKDPELNIIMCTALGQKKIIVEAAKAGAKDYVIKPYKKENITSVLEVLNANVKKSDAQVIPFKIGKKNNEVSNKPDVNLSLLQSSKEKNEEPKVLKQEKDLDKILKQESHEIENKSIYSNKFDDSNSLTRVSTMENKDSSEEIVDTDLDSLNSSLNLSEIQVELSKDINSILEKDEITSIDDIQKEDRNVASIIPEWDHKENDRLENTITEEEKPEDHQLENIISDKEKKEDNSLESIISDEGKKEDLGLESIVLEEKEEDKQLKNIVLDEKNKENEDNVLESIISNKENKEDHLLENTISIKEIKKDDVLENIVSEENKEVAGLKSIITNEENKKDEVLESLLIDEENKKKEIIEGIAGKEDNDTENVESLVIDTENKEIEVSVSDDINLATSIKAEETSLNNESFEVLETIGFSYLWKNRLTDIDFISNQGTTKLVKRTSFIHFNINRSYENDLMMLGSDILEQTTLYGMVNAYMSIENRLESNPNVSDIQILKLVNEVRREYKTRLTQEKQNKLISKTMADILKIPSTVLYQKPQEVSNQDGLYSVINKMVTEKCYRKLSM